MKIPIIILILLVTLTTGLYMARPKPEPPHETSPQLPKNSLLIRGSIPYWDQQKATQSFAENVSNLNQVALFWYYIDSNGKATKYTYALENPSILTLAHQNNIKAFFTLTNLGERAGDNWDSKRVEEVIKDNNSRAKHIEDILNIFSRLPFDGVSIDYEEVAPSQRDNFSSFIKQLAASLHQRGKLLNVAIHPVTDSNSEKRYYFQDVKNLSESADYLAVMAYGEHENDSGPGPIASYPWVNKIITYLKAKNIPLQKIFLGIPLYGYDWTEGSNNPATDLTYQDTQNLLAQFRLNLEWDEQLKSSHFTYNNQGQVHQVWFEGSRSVEQKMKLAQDAGLGGVSFWRLGEEDPNIWAEIKQFK
ncbi:hypothetical protein COU91_00145 [Candidatus Saccharibacteria bacterium CG10_big_fil_rev_8_21_14_0_10_47_8]|nr:MAG: hypothetical protein COU91_00145 [Candidatus Saccharibacteria bacterium CG10_big_fil_rev_8_21_14_0_10_47_8]